MNGIESISQRILDEAREKADAILREARDNAARQEAEGREKAEAEVAGIAQTGQSRVEAIGEKAKLDAASEARKIIAGRKQMLIGQAFGQALEDLLALPGAEYQALLAGLALEAVGDGEGGELLLCSRDRAEHGEAVMALLKGKTSGAPLTLAADTADIRGGVVIRRGKVEINCALEVIIRMLREEMSGAVAACLFGKGA